MQFIVMLIFTYFNSLHNLTKRDVLLYNIVNKSTFLLFTNVNS